MIEPLIVFELDENEKNKDVAKTTTQAIEIRRLMYRLVFKTVNIRVKPNSRFSR